MPFAAKSLTTHHPGYRSGDCGYCKGNETSQRTPDSRGSYYATTKSLSVETYQKLIDRGWRRSGTLLYKPDVFRACCPHYTIRLPAASLSLSRDQRQALNRWNRFVLGDDYPKEVAKRFPKTKQEKAQQKNQFNLLKTVHEAESDQLKPVDPAHRFEVSLEPADFTEEKFVLYKDYQVHVHHDRPSEVSRQGFKRFLCSSPIRRRTEPNSDGKPKLLGSYHQCYRLDGRLIAMGVLDLLPHAVSGVYFLYHHDFEKWSFGKLSAIREAALALEGSYQFYYMGYYIHNCVKMRYKGDYKPQYLLDPETYQFNLLDDELRQLLGRQKYVSLAREREKLAAKSDTQVTAVCGGPQHGVLHEQAQADESTISRFLMPDPKDAMDSGMSILEFGMPGVPSTEDLEKQIDLDTMRITAGRGFYISPVDLPSWERSHIEDTSTLIGIVAEITACIGPDAAKDVVLDFEVGIA